MHGEKFTLNDELVFEKNGKFLTFRRDVLKMIA